MRHKLAVPALVLMLGLGATTAAAQPPVDTTAQNIDERYGRGDDGFNWGWLGLVGLAGLMGLKRSEHRDRTVGRGDLGHSTPGR